MQSKREIKFQAYSYKDQRMLRGYPRIIKGEFDSFIEDITGSCYGAESWELRLREFTGLKDTNGVEIFEGDILCCNDESWKGEVFCCEHSLQWMCNDHGLCDIYMPQVIGNIYQNEELLK